MMIGKIIDGYQVIDSLGSGAFGHTYKVKKDSFIYAMKILKPDAMNTEIQSGGLKRFQKEVRGLQKVNSEFVVKYVDNGVWRYKEIDHYYIIMEYVKGVDFNKYLSKSKEVFLNNESLMRKIFSGILCGLYDMHKKSIIHRDLKPANIFITAENDVKLLDFGLIKMLDYSTITTRGKILGTPLFMSPEIIEGKSIDYRSDLYSFGVILYYIFTNEYPFTGENVFVLLQNVITKPPQKISDKCLDISNALENIILKLLEKHPYLRPFKSSLELKEVINEVPIFKKSIDIIRESDKSYKKKRFFVRLLMNEKTEVKKYIESGGYIDAVEFPANFLPKYKAQLEDLKKNNIPYYFDPSTNRITYSTFSNTKGLVELPYVYDRFNKLTPKNLSSLNNLQKYVSDVLNWQLKWGCKFLVAPFHYSKTLADDWFSIDMKLLEEAIELKNKEFPKHSIYAGICFSIEELTDEESRLELVNRYSRTLPDGFVFYINDIAEKTTNRSQLYAYIDLLLKFKKLKRPIIAGRVGTLGLGLLELGIDAFSQGIASLTGFSERTLLANRSTNYDMERKYYIPSLFLTVQTTLANDILTNFSKYRCNCNICKGDYGYNKISRNAKAHFLEVRSKEVDAINNKESDFLMSVKSAQNEIKRVKRKLKLPNTNHIDTWIEVFEEFRRSK